MKTSSYLEQTLFFEQSSATDQYFEDRASQLFESSEKPAFIEFYKQLPRHDSVSSEAVWIHKHDYDGKPSAHSDSEPPSPVDSHRFLRKDPPRYVEPARLECCKVSKIGELTEFARVS